MLHLRLYLKNYWEAQFDEFDYVKYETHFTEEEPCNIYLVGIRPRVMVDPNYHKITDSKIELRFFVQDKHDRHEIIGQLPLNRAVQGSIQIESDAPYSRFNIKDDKGYFFDKEFFKDENNIQGKALYALRQSHHKATIAYNDIELLYIGKSVKMDKKVSPLKRVQNHSKIQKILQKCTTKYFDKEVYIVLCSFVKKIDLMALSEQLVKYKGKSDTLLNKLQDDIKILNATHELITQVSEAVLIDYFDTREFNHDFIGSFGRKSHLYYPYIIKSAISTISIELDLSKTCNTFSKTISTKAYHSFKYFPKDNFSRTSVSSLEEFKKY